MFFAILKNIWPENLKKLFDDIFADDSKIRNIFIQLAAKPHMLIALWNYGFKYSPEHVPKDCTLRPMLIKYHNVDLPIGFKYQALMNDKCPITLQSIRTPAILTDGTVYEFDAIKTHLKKSDLNPLTNSRLVMSDKYGRELLTKTIYLPEASRFDRMD